MTIIKSINKLTKESNQLQKFYSAEHFAADPFKPLNKWFKELDKFFKKLKKAFTPSKEKSAAVILTIILPFFGQLAARIFYLNGSLHMPWLFLFAIPPLTLLPAFFIMFDIIPKGKGGKPYDLFVMLPIIVSLLYDLYFIQFVPDDKASFIKIFLIFLSFFLIYIYRSYKICKDKIAPMTKIISDTLITNIFVSALVIGFNYIPVFGIFFKVINRLIPYANHLITFFSYVVVYTLVNMVNGSDNDYCKKGESFFKIFLLIILIVIISFKKNHNIINN